MAEVSALKKHPCPECGGDAEWDAAKKALACPYCGTVLPWSDGEDTLGASISEHNLETALAAITPENRGLKAEKKCWFGVRSLRLLSCLFYGRPAPPARSLAKRCRALQT